MAVVKTVRKVPEHQEATQEGKDRRKNAGPGNRDVKALFVSLSMTGTLCCSGRKYTNFSVSDDRSKISFIFT